MVAMKAPGGGALIGAAAGIVVLHAEIADMAEQMAGRVLRHRPAEMQAETEIGDGGALEAELGHRQAAQIDKAAALEQLLPDVEEKGREGRQRKVAATHVENGGT